MKEEDESSDKEKTFGEELTSIVAALRWKGESRKEEVHCPKEECVLKKGGAGVSSEEESVEVEDETAGGLCVAEEGRGAEAGRGEGVGEEVHPERAREWEVSLMQSQSPWKARCGGSGQGKS